MAEIVPAIIAKDFEELKDKIRKTEPFVNRVQLDVMDGKFVLEKTGYRPEDFKKIETNLDSEVHLMIEEPEKEIDRWINSGVKRILVHPEALGDRELGIRNWELISKKCKENNIELGLALNLDTPIDILSQFLVAPPKAKLAKGGSSHFLIQLMSIAKIGYYGHSFDERVIPKIKSLREKYPNVKIAVDGGINSQTAKEVVQAGADILVVGSAIFNNADIGQAINEIKKQIS